MVEAATVIADKEKGGAANSELYSRGWSKELYHSRSRNINILDL